MAELSRRTFTTAGAAGIGLLLCTPTANALDRALRRTATRSVSTAGTTLEQVATAVASGPAYTRLTGGPGWPLAVRGDLAAPKSGRDERRRALSAFVQFTDLHITDAESPARFEYLHPYIGSAHRPQEALGTVATSALVQRVNSVRQGPFTGRPFDLMVTTGDNTDNHEHLELDWFLKVLNGGTVTPNSGDSGSFEGVQTSGNKQYWNPSIPTGDAYSAKGFPQLPGLLEAGTATFTAPGLDVPWFCTFGNHDDSIVGSLPAQIPGIDAWYTGKYKIIGKDETTAKKLADAIRKPGSSVPVGELFGGSGTIREVTPDARRRPFSTGEFVRAHLDTANTGPGPVGHGFTGANADGQNLYYTFRIAPGITGISLDTTTDAGFADGSIGLAQYSWVESTLKRNSSTYYDFFGRKVTHGVTDELFVLFSHHTSGSMGNLLPDSRHLLDPRLDGNAFVALLKRFPNVLAWVNGHTHLNRITPHAGGTPAQGFWEINTASHIDFPQHARIIEVADNADGTLSLFTTLIEAEAPYAADYASRTPQALASLYRELSYNDLHTDLGRVGAATDHNTELLLVNPLS